MAINQQAAGLRLPAPRVPATRTPQSPWQHVRAWWWEHWTRPTLDRAMAAHALRQAQRRNPKPGYMVVANMVVEDALLRRLG